MLFFNANFICYYFYPTKKREEPKFFPLPPIDSFCHPLPYNEDSEPDR